ncbi:MAG: hypothetical protein M3P06_24020 [Acidobacteriota bacterium]|nr:hypothetical protein [Acidobacteriota bacterium]
MRSFDSETVLAQIGQRKEQCRRISPAGDSGNHAARLETLFREELSNGLFDH